jgi:hypothetical protein
MRGRWIRGGGAAGPALWVTLGATSPAAQRQAEEQARGDGADEQNEQDEDGCPRLAHVRRNLCPKGGARRE